MWEERYEGKNLKILSNILKPEREAEGKNLFLVSNHRIFWGTFNFYAIILFNNTYVN